MILLQFHAIYFLFGESSAQAAYRLTNIFASTFTTCVDLLANNVLHCALVICAILSHFRAISFPLSEGSLCIGCCLMIINILVVLLLLIYTNCHSSSHSDKREKSRKRKKRNCAAILALHCLITQINLKIV